MRRIAICDDSETYIDLIQDWVKQYISEKNIEFNIDRYTSGEELIKMVEVINYNLVLLDINMPEVSGFDVEERTYEKTQGDNLVFVSSENNLVFQTLSFRPLFFVRKDSLEEDLKKAIDKWFEFSGNEELLELENNIEQIRIPLTDITFIEVQKHYLVINFVKDRVTVRGKMSELDYLLDDDTFIKTHMSYICNNRYVKEIKDTRVILMNNIEVPLSRSKVRVCREKFKQYTVRQII